MTTDDQTFIMQQMQQHFVMNKGNTMTDVLIHGFTAVLGMITSSRLDKQPEKENADSPAAP